MAEEREVWGKQLEFILTLIGYAVGLGNVWRFPYLCYKNGGGAFLIPYVICLFLLGIPMFALECAFGQFGAKGPLSIWSINPLFKGIGATVVFSAFLIFIYYNIIIAIAIRFFIASMTSDLPWVGCDSCDCLLYKYGKNVSAETIFNMTYNNSLGVNCTNLSVNATKSPSEIYFNVDILSDSGTMEEIGSIRWELLVCNLVAYTIIFLVLVKGINSLGKIVYFTATFPYILLIILLVRVAMLDGAQDGVDFYLKPDWSKLGDATVWSDAATQIFFSISACLGGLICMASYNRFNNNIIRDSLIVPIINCLTSFFAGFVVFCTLGYMAHLKNTDDVGEVVKGGPGLVFVVYPEAIGAMPVSTLWAVLFFFTICILGFSTQFSNAETVMTSLIDEFPTLLSTKKRQIIMRFIVCLMGFILGIPMCTEGGQDLLNLVDGALLGFPILLVGMFELLAVIHVYGYNRFADDIEMMVGFRPFLYFRVTWVVVSPLLLLAVFVFKAYDMTDFEPAWKGLLYYLIVIFLVMWIPLGFFYYGRIALLEAMKPQPYWKGREEHGDGDPSHNKAPQAMMELKDMAPGEDNKEYIYSVKRKGSSPTWKPLGQSHKGDEEKGGHFNQGFITSPGAGSPM